MFRTKGWQQFVEDMEGIFDSYSIEDIKDEKQLLLIQGERRILQQILRFELSLQDNYDLLLEEDKDVGY
jgi:hypothetical protein